MNEFIENLRKIIAQDTAEETTDSQNLTLTKQQFIAKIFEYEDGKDLLHLFELGEWRVAERLGLINGYDGESPFDIPRWNNLIAHLRIVNSV